MISAQPPQKAADMRPNKNCKLFGKNRLYTYYSFKCFVVINASPRTCRFQR